MKQLIAVLLFSLSAFGQGGFRFDSQAIGPKGILPNVTITVCPGTATGTPCSPQATTFTDITLGTACSASLQVTLTGTNSCQATSDVLGNYGFWLAPGTYLYSITGANITGKTYTLTVPVGADSSGNASAGNFTVGPSNTLTVNNIKQQAGAGFNVFDPNNGDHFFISSSPPYTNTFLAGNGAGVVFLGSSSKASADDVTGALTTAGNLILQTTAQTLPANIRNDTAGGILFANNAGGSFQFGNGGTIFLNVLGGGIRWSGATSGTTVVQASAAAGSTTLTLPAATGTLSCNTCAQTLTATTLSSPVITSPTINTGVTQGSGLKHQRFGTTCTTGASAGNTCTTAYTWTSAFADANYTASCFGGGGVGTNPQLAISGKSASQLTVTVQTNFNVASSYGTVDCIAIHD